MSQHQSLYANTACGEELPPVSHSSCPKLQTEGMLNVDGPLIVLSQEKINKRQKHKVSGEGEGGGQGCLSV